MFRLLRKLKALHEPLHCGMLFRPMSARGQARRFELATAPAALPSTADADRRLVPIDSWFPLGVDRDRLPSNQRGSQMQRRTCIAGLGSAAAWPLATRAQQSGRVRRIGALISLPADDPEQLARMTAFLQGLRQLG